jgi:hypothetical protein
VRRVNRLSLGERTLADHRGEGVEHAVARSDARQRIAHDSRSADAAFGHGSGNLAGRRPGCIHGG